MNVCSNVSVEETRNAFFECNQLQMLISKFEIYKFYTETYSNICLGLPMNVIKKGQ